MLHGDGGVFQIGPHPGNLLLADVGDDLQLFGRVSGNDTGHSRRGNALHVVRIGDNDTLDILNDAAAGANDHPVRHCAQNLTGFRRAVGQGNGFRAAHSGDKLLFQDPDVRAVIGILLVHFGFLLSFVVTPRRCFPPAYKCA